MEIHQIVVNSMLVVASTWDISSTLMAGKQEVLYSLMVWDSEILTTALPVLLCSSAGEASSGRPGLHPHPTVVACTSIRVTCTRRMRTTVRAGSP